MNKNWGSVVLGDVCKLLNGRAYKKAELLDSGRYPVLRVGNFFTNQHWYYSDIELPEDKYCVNGDLLYAWSASFGPRIWEGGKVIYHYHIWKVAFDKNYISKKFLFYWLEWDKEKIRSDQGAGTTMIHVTKSSMENRKLLLPPLAEQKRIVAILDQDFAGIDKAIANTEQNLANARELFENYVNSSLCDSGNGWTDVTLAQACAITSSLIDPREAAYRDLPHIGAANIASNTGTLSNVHTASEAGLKSGKFLFDGTMVLYSKIRPYLMKVTRPDFSGLCSADIYPLAPNTEVMSRDFLYYLLLSSAFTEYAIRGSARAGMPKVNREHLFAYKTHIPTIQVQRRLVETFDKLAIKIQELESNYLQQITMLTNLKQSLLHKAFSGELTADPERETEAALP